QTFCPPGQVVEIRALHVRGRGKAVCRVCADLAGAAAFAQEMDRLGAAGIYFTPNPIRPDLAGSKASCKAADMVERHWLLVDVDPTRPAGVSSTQEELDAAWEVLGRVQATLEGGGLTNPVICASGNGWHCCFPISLPNDQPAHDLVKDVLKQLNER